MHLFSIVPSARSCRRATLTLALVASCVFSSIAFGQSARRDLPDHASSIASQLVPIDRFSLTNRLHLAIGLPLRNEDALDDFLKEVYDPQSSNYRNYLTPQEFTQRFGPTENDFQSVIQFAEANNLTVTVTYSNRVVLDVVGSVADIERTFQVELRTYQHPAEARTFFAPNVAPSVPSELPVLAVSGLDNFSIPHPKHVQRTVPAATPQSGSGSSGSYGGNDFRAAYVPGVTLTGTGQSVALLEFDGYYTSDITKYESTFGLPSVTLTNVAVDGGVNKPGTGNSEVALDIEMVIAMAPGLSKVLVYEAPNPSPWPDIIGKMANDNLAKQISCSWGGGSPDATSEQLFKQMAAQGQSFYNASGDGDAFSGSIPFPSDSTNITQVGGTTLTTSGPGGSWVSETVWNWGRNHGSYTGSSGGISTFYGIPSWQLGINMVANHGSTTMRNVPDVALTADNIHVNYNNGSIGIFGGTSCAAPLWAAYTALVNQQNATASHPPVGFVNPALYSIGKTNLLANYHDITTGNNFTQSSPTNFPAVSGFDLCTGWGTPNANLINILAPLGVITNPPPVAAFVASPTNGAVPLTVNFTNTTTGATNYTWNFGDGHTSNATNAVNTYTNAGIYTVTLTAVGAAGTNSLTRTSYIVVTNVPPSISTPPQSLTVRVGSNVTFTVTAAGTSPLAYQWRFNTTNISGATSSSYTRTNAQLSDAGNYTVVVTNIAGSITSAPGVLTVTSPPPLVAFVASVTNGISPLVVNFTNLSSGATNYSWTFGDGHTNNAANPTNTYTTQGSYTVTLTAFGPGGQATLTRTNYIVLSNAPPVLAAISDRSIHVGTTLLITNTATDPDTAQTLTFILDAGAPAGANMTTNGLFSWTPDNSFVNTTNNISARVADNGSPSLSDAKVFTVTVLPLPLMDSSAFSTSTGGVLTLSWSSISGQTYRVQYSTNIGTTNWFTLPPDVTATNSTASKSDSILSDPQRFYRIVVLP